MFRKMLLTAALLCCAAGLMAQTVDFTGITVKTEKVKKAREYKKRSFIMVPASMSVLAGSHLAFTGGIRFGQVRKFGWYGDVEIGFQGLPFRTIDGGSCYYKSGYYYTSGGSKIVSRNASDTKMGMFSITGGFLWSVLEKMSLYGGLTVAPWQDVLQAKGSTYLIAKGVGVGPEAGIIGHLGGFAFSLGLGYPQIYKLGLGVNF